MKKFLLPLLMTFALLIPAIQAQAADVPNFRQVAGDSVGGGKRENKKNYQAYTYIVDGKYSTGLAERYVNFLQENGITLIKHKEGRYENRIDFWLTHCYDDYFFSCRGHDVVFSLRRYEYAPNEQYEIFSIRISNELTYEED